MKSSKMNKLITLKLEKFDNLSLTLFVGYFVFFMICNCFSLALYWLGHRMVDSDWLDNLFIMVNTLAYQHYFIGFMLTIYTIYFALDCVNEYLSSLVQVDEVISDDEVVEALKTVKILVDKICDILEKVQLLYAINTIAFILYFSFFCMFCFYGIFSFFLPGASNQGFIFWTLAFLWTFYNLLFFVWTFVFASWLKQEGPRIELSGFKLLYKFQGSSEKVVENIKLLSMQIKHRAPKFSCGLFVVDWYFLFWLIGTVFSYLLILIQFGLKM